MKTTLSMKPCRLAVTGKTSAPSLYHLPQVVGKKRGITAPWRRDLKATSGFGFGLAATRNLIACSQDENDIEHETVPLGRDRQNLRPQPLPPAPSRRQETRDYRAVAQRFEGDVWVWIWIGSHKEFDRL